MIRKVGFKKERRRNQAVRVSTPCSVGCLRHLRAVKRNLTTSADIEALVGKTWHRLAPNGDVFNWMELARWCLRIAYTLDSRSEGRYLKKIERAYKALEV